MIIMPRSRKTTFQSIWVGAAYFWFFAATLARHDIGDFEFRGLNRRGAMNMDGVRMLLSLRNTFRRKGRLALTLSTLTLGGAIFIAICNVQSGLQRTFESVVFSFWKHDVLVTFEQPQRASEIERAALAVPGVRRVANHISTIDSPLRTAP